jgi:hypothetical protein
MTYQDLIDYYNSFKEVVVINDLEDLDYILYEKGLIESPNQYLGNYVMLSCAGRKRGNFNSIEELPADIELVSATEYFKEV